MSSSSSSSSSSSATAASSSSSSSSSSSAPTITVNVKTLKGPSFPLTVPFNLPVSRLHQLISEQQNLPIDRQRIIHQGKRLMDDKTLADYHIEDGDALHLILRDTPAPPSTSSSSAASTTSTTSSVPPPANTFNPMMMPPVGMTLTQMNFDGNNGGAADINQFVNGILSQFNVNLNNINAQAQQQSAAAGAHTGTAQPIVPQPMMFTNIPMMQQQMRPQTQPTSTQPNSTTSAAQSTTSPPSQSMPTAQQFTAPGVPAGGVPPMFMNRPSAVPGVPNGAMPMPMPMVQQFAPPTINQIRELLNQTATSMTHPQPSSTSASIAPANPLVHNETYEETLTGLTQTLSQLQQVVSALPPNLNRVVEQLRAQSLGSPAFASVSPLDRQRMQREAHELAVTLRRLAQSAGSVSRALTHIAPQHPSNTAPLALSPFPVVPLGGPVEGNNVSNVPPNVNPFAQFVPTNAGPIIMQQQQPMLNMSPFTPTPMPVPTAATTSNTQSATTSSLTSAASATSTSTDPIQAVLRSLTDLQTQQQAAYPQFPLAHSHHMLRAQVHSHLNAVVPNETAEARAQRAQTLLASLHQQMNELTARLEAQQQQQAASYTNLQARRLTQQPTPTVLAPAMVNSGVASISNPVSVTMVTTAAMSPGDAAGSQSSNPAASVPVSVQVDIMQMEIPDGNGAFDPANNGAPRGTNE